jgi:hypothetical protein
MPAARPISATCDCPFERAIELSCRKNARIFDPRLPGGNALGKIVRYGFSAEGDSGRLIGTVTIGCVICFAGVATELPGTPALADDGYVDLGYQFYVGQIEVLPAGDVGYTVPIDEPDDDGLVFPLQAVPFDYGPEFVPASLSPTDFEGVVDTGNTQAARTAIETILKSRRCHLDFTVLPVAGSSFENAYEVTVTDLVVPNNDRL